jgi:hypothetical protein
MPVSTNVPLAQIRPLSAAVPVIVKSPEFGPSGLKVTWESMVTRWGDAAATGPAITTRAMDAASTPRIARA